MKFKEKISERINQYEACGRIGSSFAIFHISSAFLNVI